jgi:flagellar biosynthesis protein FlhF
MRLRTFIGRTTAEAMALVREHLGPDAIIISTEEDKGGGRRVTAALDQDAARTSAPTDFSDVIGVIGEALSAHAVAPALVEKILAATLSFDVDDPLVALSGALTSLYSFAPITTERHADGVLFAGAPGAGKTVSLAKLAARAVLTGQSVRIVTADTARAGGVEQLESFARILRSPFDVADSAQGLKSILAAAGADELVLIDTPGINPYSASDRRDLAGLIAASGAEPILTLAAGGDAGETIEMAQAFQELGCQRAIVTRLDMVHRLGSVLAAADEIGFALAEGGVAASIADGLVAFTPVLLARLLLPKPPPLRAPSPGPRGMS